MGLGKWTSRTRSPQGSWSTPSSSGLAQFAVGGSYVVYPDPPGPNVSEPDGGDCGSNQSTQCRVAVGGSVTGDLTQQDGDVFAVELVQGETYQFDLEGADTGQGTNPDPNLLVFDYDLPSADQIVASDGNSGQGKNAQATFTPETTKTYYLLARGTRVGGQNTQGTYRLTVRNVRNISVSEPRRGGL